MSQNTEFIEAVCFRGHGDYSIAELMRQAADYLEANQDAAIWDITISIEDNSVIVYRK